jgi:outer membrane protein assembly factor BamB
MTGRQFTNLLTRSLCASAPRRETILLMGVVIVLLAAGLASAENWPRFRGPNGDGQSDAAGIPSEWSEADYQWKISLPGLGHSSPVIWGDRLFVTSADPSTAEQIVLAVDARTGAQLWEQRFDATTHRKHATNSFATSTPAADAEQIYLAWMNGQRVTLAALTHDGVEIWRRELATLDEHHGFGTSPVVVGDVVSIANETNDAAQSAVFGLDRTSGDLVWRLPRGTGKTAYATPCLWNSPAGGQLLLMSSMGSGLTAFDPASGEIAWQGFERELPDRCVSSPIVGGGMVFISCGSGNNGMHMIAARPGSDGNPPQEVYRLRQGVPNIPTPVVAGDLLFLWHDRGTVSCLDIATGHEHWRERVGGKFHSSPLRIGDRIFCTSLDGEVVVLAASKDFQLLARNALGEPCTATPAVADNRIYFRTESSLISLGAAAAN